MHVSDGIYERNVREICLVVFYSDCPRYQSILLREVFIRGSSAVREHIPGNNMSSSFFARPHHIQFLRAPSKRKWYSTRIITSPQAEQFRQRSITRNPRMYFGYFSLGVLVWRQVGYNLAATRSLEQFLGIKCDVL